MVEEGQTAWSDPLSSGDEASFLDLRTPDGDEQTKAMLFSGPPIKESVVFGGPLGTGTTYATSLATPCASAMPQTATSDTSGCLIRCRPAPGSEPGT